MSELMTLDEVAAYLRVTTKTVYRLIDRRAIPAKKVGRQWRFSRDSIDSWLQQNTIKTGANILVIDDDESVAALFRDTLDGSGHTITFADTSSQGLDLVQMQDFDLVFLDLKMPVLDGAEVFKQIRSVRPELPVTIITGYADSDLMRNALAYGPLGVMSKPFSGSDILVAVHNYLRFGMPSR